MLSDDGLINEAHTAARLSDIADIIEKVKVEIVTVQAKNGGYISEAKLKEIIKKYDKDGEIKKTDKDEEYITSKKGNDILVKDLYDGLTSEDGWNGEFGEGSGGNEGEGGDDSKPNTGGIYNSWRDDMGVCAPILLEGMKPVVYYGEGKISYVEDPENDEWYDYSQKQWANAVTGYTDEAGNYIVTGQWVWIPRFEYKIVNATSVAVAFIPLTKIEVDEGYKCIHPAFRKDDTNKFINGEWDEELPGFWISKFQAGYQHNSLDNSGSNITSTIINSEGETYYSSVTYTSDRSTVLKDSIIQGERMSYPVFLPLTYLYDQISSGEAYDLSRSIEQATGFYGLNSLNCDSHLIKSSEWGAVVYLSMSNYGAGTKLTRNAKTFSSADGFKATRITGLGGGVLSRRTGSSTYYSHVDSGIQKGYKWWTSSAFDASSSKSIYGVYDLNGPWEYISAYITSGSSALDNYSSNFAYLISDTKGYEKKSTKYVTVYPYTSETEKENYELYKSLCSGTNSELKPGDALFELIPSTSSYHSVYGEQLVNGFLRYPLFDSPIMMRGGSTYFHGSASTYYYDDPYYGESSCQGGTGEPKSAVSFRVVLCGKSNKNNL